MTRLKGSPAAAGEAPILPAEALGSSGKPPFSSPSPLTSMGVKGLCFLLVNSLSRTPSSVDPQDKVHGSLSSTHMKLERTCHQWMETNPAVASFVHADGLSEESYLL